MSLKGTNRIESAIGMSHASQPDYDTILSQHQTMALEVLQNGGANLLSIHDMDHGMNANDVLVSYKITRDGFRSVVPVPIDSVLEALAVSWHPYCLIKRILEPIRQSHNVRVEPFLKAMAQQHALNRIIEHDPHQPGDTLTF